MKMNEKDRFELTGKRALITGSAQGIGYAIARQFAAHGCSVWIHDKDDADKCVRACAELQRVAGTHPEYVVADFEHPQGVENLIAEAPEIDILILNASMQVRAATNAITREEFDLQVNTNFWATLRLIQHYLPKLVQQQWGRVVTIGSIQESSPHPQMAIYAALKAAISNLVVNIARQVGQDGVTVNNIAPGVIETSRNRHALSDAAYATQVRKDIPLGYFGEPEDCAGIALLLCSEAGRYITGQTIYCDGGMSIR